MVTVTSSPFELGQYDEVFCHMRKENKGILPVKHPTLMALYIVLDLKGDFSDISRNHLHLEEQHKYFKPSTKFPDNISDLLPPYEDCWWDELGKLLLSIVLFCSQIPHSCPAGPAKLPNPFQLLLSAPCQRSSSFFHPSLTIPRRM
jgi:hypothetical protein